jgi:hypothetical protein
VGDGDDGFLEAMMVLGGGTASPLSKMVFFPMVSN